MAQHDYVLENASGALLRQDMNNALRAIAENNMGATAPTTTYAGMWWLDISTNPATLRIRNNANTAWISCGNLNEMSYLAGVTSAIQTQLNAKAALASPALTGVPTAPTPTTGDRTTKIATTAMFDSEFTKSLAVNGYQKLPSGLIIQWGMINSVATDTPVNLTFPIAFSAHVPWVGTQSESSCLSSGAERNPIIYNNGFTGCTIRMGNACNGISIKWMAIGV
jgi:hypothetical protein